MKVIIFLIILIAVRIIYYTYYHILSKFYLQKYETYIKTKDDWYFSDHKKEIVHLFKMMGIKDSSLPYSELVGYGQVSTGHVSFFENLHIKREDIFNMVIAKLRESGAISLNNIKNTFNPIKWIELIVYLPEITLSYIGLKKEKLFVKIIQVVWWIFAVLSAISSVFFNESFSDFLKGFLK